MNVSGTIGDDTLAGSPEADAFFMKDGNDLATGGDGDDIFFTGPGDDQAFASNGNDTLFGGDGADTLGGGAGLDLIYGGAGNDVAFGGDDSDAIYVDIGDDQVFGGEGDDQIGLGAGNDEVFAGGGSDTVFGGAGNDNLGGGDGDDTLWGGAGADTLFGGAGVDTAAYEGTRDDFEGSNRMDGGFEVTNTATGEIDVLYGVEKVNIGGTDYALSDLVPAENVTARYKGEVNADSQRPDGTMPFGADNTPENYHIVAVTNVDTGLSLEMGQKAHIRGGADYDAVRNADGSVSYNVDAGADSTASTRAAWSIDHVLNPNTDNETGQRELGDDVGDIGYRVRIDTDIGAGVNYVDLTLVEGTGQLAGRIYLANAAGTIGLGDETAGDGLFADSFNYGFFSNAVDGDPNSAGVQAYTFGPAQFDVEFEAYIIGANNTETLIAEQTLHINVQAPPASLAAELDFV